MPPAARILAEWAARLRPEDIPVTVGENAVRRVLDTLGCALAGAREDHVPALLALLERSGEGPCTVVGSALTSGPAPAALVNGAMAHGLDFDDTHADSVCHASAVLVPTVLALVESEHLTGRAALTALVAGYEAMIRIGMAAPGRFHTRGWHATAACGPFGAAVTAGKCLGLDEDGLTAALGIAASMASGVLEFLEDGSWVKRLHPGWAAQSGIQAAILAQGGFTGPATGLEGRFGFLRAALGEAVDVGKGLDDLGHEWETVRSSFKLYPCCHLSHAYLDAITRLKRTRDLRAEEVEEIECLVPAGRGAHHLRAGGGQAPAAYALRREVQPPLRHRRCPRAGARGHRRLQPGEHRRREPARADRAGEAHDRPRFGLPTHLPRLGTGAPQGRAHSRGARREPAGRAGPADRPG